MVRKAKREDAAEIGHISREVLGHHDADDEAIKKKIDSLAQDDTYYIVVFIENFAGRAVGFLQAQRYNLIYGGDGWNIIALAVASEYQHAGIGTALVNSLEAYSREWGGSFIRLNCRVERIEAHKFYEALGYHCDKEQKRFIKYLENTSKPAEFP